MSVTSVIPAIDPIELAAWNARNERAREEYDRDPSALGDLLAKVCFDCRNRNHSGCGGLTYVGGRMACRCWVNWHREVEW